MSAIDLEVLQSWRGRHETSETVLVPAPARALAATLNHDPFSIDDGCVLPPLYHWVYFPILARSSDLAQDGHARKGAFMPPVPFPRRMFAGARVEYRGVLRVGDRVRRVATIQSVEYKEGRSGPLVFVTVGYELSDEDGIKIIEAQDIAYRPATTSTPAPRPREAIPVAQFCGEIVPNESLLFRYSALTFNAHRIHYDLPFARAEGYPTLVVHGPLTATLLADLVARETGASVLTRFSFRARSALFLGERMRLLGRRQGSEIALAAVNDAGVIGVEARAVLA